MGCTGHVIIIRILQTTLVLFILTSFTASATSVHDDVLDSDASMPFGGRRNLLQIKSECSLDFDNVDSTNISTKCKKPFTKDQCCPAFKEFACPIASYINDLSTTCSEAMFGFLHQKFELPPALFSSLCREGPEGLKCPKADVPPPPPPQSNGGPIDVLLSPLYLISLLAAADMLAFILH